MRILARALITLADHVVLLFSSLCLLLRHLCQAVRFHTYPHLAHLALGGTLILKVGLVKLSGSREGIT